MRALLWIPSLFMVACGRQAIKPDSPTPVPAIVEVPVPTFVPIESELTARCQWVQSAPLEQMPSVARGRRKCLEQYEGQFDAIERVQGRPVPKISTPKPAIQRKR